MLSRKPKHKALIMSDDRRLRPVTLEVDTGFVVQHSSSRAWQLTGGAVFPERRTRLPYLLVHERHDCPYSTAKHRWEKHEEGAVNQLARQSIRKEFNELPKKALAQKAASAFRLAIAGLTLTVALMAMVVLISSGQFKFPGM